MTNQAGCSYCTDSNYFNQSLCEAYGNSGNGATWIVDAGMNELDCEALDGDWFSGEVGGFQIELSNISILSATGPSGYFMTTSSTLIIGFSLTGATIPAGSEILLSTVSFTGYAGESICFGEDTGSAGTTAISDAVGGYLAADWGECYGSSEEISGCMDMDACNYSGDATADDGSCEYAMENYDCDGNCTADIDCAGECGGSAMEDECGECDGNGADVMCEDLQGALRRSRDARPKATAA